MDSWNLYKPYTLYPDHHSAQGTQSSLQETYETHIHEAYLHKDLGPYLSFMKNKQAKVQKLVVQKK